MWEFGGKIKVGSTTSPCKNLFCFFIPAFLPPYSTPLQILSPQSPITQYSTSSLSLYRENFEAPTKMEVDDKEVTTIGEKKQPLKIDFAELFGEDHDEPEQELVVVPTKLRRRRRSDKERKLGRKSSEDDPPTPPHGGEDYSYMSVEELKVKIERMSRTISSNVARNLPDGGVKLKAQFQGLQDELSRRESSRTHEVADGYEKQMHSESSSMKGGSKRAVPSSQSPSRSHFASFFLKKLEDDNPKLEHDTNIQTNNALNREVSCMNACDKSKRKSAGKLPHSKRANPGLYSEGFSVWKPANHSPRIGAKYMQLNEKLVGRLSSTDSLPLLNDKTAGSLTDKDDSQALDCNGSKSEKTVVLVDEEEPELVEKKFEAKELPLKPSDGKIYYPSREDPESLEILRSELKCLEPGECLTSTIMNFYVRFLQKMCSPADSSLNNFYFFNTYFYSKLQEAVAYQKSDKEAFFMKFRRWWKGVTIFQKAYIFLPINEDNHWSLVIICMPDEESDSGLIILHLDSLGLHSSSSIFDNIKSLLINEWKILNEDFDAVNISIPPRIWKHLPRRIDQKIIPVPRQTNDYDCGLFVLYYMERFIQDAPERLSRQQLSDKSLFGKSWFKPQEASRLRGKIKQILQEEFHKALRQDNWTWEPVCFSANADTAKDIDSAECS